MNAPFMKAISINFHGLPSSKNITQDFAIRASLITIEGQPDGLIVTGVFVDGLPQWTAPGSTPATIFIRPPLPQQGERIEVRCVVPLLALESPAKGSKWLHPTNPSPDHSYGLQRPSFLRAETNE